MLVEAADAELVPVVGHVQMLEGVVEATGPQVGQRQISMSPLVIRLVGVPGPDLGEGDEPRRVDPRIGRDGAQDRDVGGEPGVLGVPESFDDQPAVATVPRRIPVDQVREAVLHDDVWTAADGDLKAPSRRRGRRSRSGV